MLLRLSIGTSVSLGTDGRTPMSSTFGSQPTMIGGEPRTKPLRVLIVEDSEDDADLLLVSLRRGGYDVAYRRAETADEMRAALAEGGWDVILSDYSLPDFDANSALVVLKESGVDIPFIIISGKIGEETAVAALHAGAHDFLVKGNFARLIPAIERSLAERAVRSARRDAEQALRESEMRFRRLAESGLVGLVLFRWGTCVVYTRHSAVTVINDMSTPNVR